MALVFLSTLKLNFKYFRVQEDDTISLEFFLWGFINYKVEVPVLVVQQKLSGLSIKLRTELETGGDHSREVMGQSAEHYIESLNKVLKKFQELLLYKEDFKYLLHHLRVERFAWQAQIGTPDAATTALLTGLAWGVMGNITSTFYQQIAPNWHKPQLQVEPNFKKEGFSTSLNCIFKIRVGNIMVTGLRILKKKVTRLGENNNGRTSHRRVNENSYGKY